MLMESRVSVTCQRGPCMDFSVVSMSTALGSDVHLQGALSTCVAYCSATGSMFPPLSHLILSSPTQQWESEEGNAGASRPGAEGRLCEPKSGLASCGGAWLKEALPFGHREAGRTRMAFSF